MRKSLLNIGILAAALLSGSASAQVTRGTVEDTSPSGTPRGWQGTHVDASLLGRTRHAVEQNADPRFRIVERNVTPRSRKTRGNAAAAPRAAALKGTEFKGFRTWPAMGASGPGWYRFLPSGSTAIWEKPSAMTTPSGGFIRNGQLYAFAHVATTTGVTDAGMYLMNEADGNPVGTLNFDVFDGADKVVQRAVYDPDSDMAYVVTYNKGGNGYILQKFDPVNYTFTDLGVTVPSDWIAFAWSPVDKTVYMLDESCTLKKYDSKGKKFVSVKSFSYDNDTYTTAMAYSPKDDAFLALIPTWDSSDNEVIDAVLLGLDGSLSKVGTPGDEQWCMLECSDPYVDMRAPKAPAVVSVDVAGASLKGTITLTLPSEYESGNAITGTVYLEVTLDGTAVSGTPSGQPGASVSVPVSVSEGMHRYLFTPYVLTDNGKLYGSPAAVDRFFGNDTPDAPADVTLSSSVISWKTVTEGVNGGYVDASAITYNVYLDGAKLNSQPVSGTSYPVNITGASSAGHVAEVEAVCGGKVSSKGVSERFYGRGAMNLPVAIAPDPVTGDMDQSMINMFAIQRDPLNTEELRGWRYDDQQDHTGGFYVLCPKESSKGSVADEWLFLPAISFPDKDKLYRFTMDVWTGNHYFTAPETYEVTLTKNPDSSDAVVVREAATVEKKPGFETSEVVFSVPEEGVWYIGIHYVSPLDSYRLYTRNYRVEEANASSDAPGAVTALTAEAAARGELKAVLTFRMPEVSVSGNALDAAAEITAKAVSEGGEATVKGAPGAEVSLTVPTVQGDNVIKVSTSSAEGFGLMAETVVYTGVYRPAAPYVTQTASDDNCTLTVNVELPEKNELGQYAGTDGDVIIYRKISDEWRPYEDIGAARTWSFEVPDCNVQDLYQFGVATRNAAGYCETMTTFGVHLGKLFQIPLTEAYALDGENVIMEYEPVTIEHLSEMPAEWGFCDPKDVDENAANASGVALYATWEADTQISLPRFSTKNAHNAKLDLSLFFGDKSPRFVSVYASSPALGPTLVDQFQPGDGSGWEHKLITLPSECQNQGWVQIVVRCDIFGYSQYFLMDGWSVADYPAEMVTITGVDGNSRALVGETVEIGVELQNAGTKDAAMPAYTFRLIGDNGVIGDLNATDAPSTIKAGEKVRLSFLYTPKAADMGDVLARFNIEGQPAQAVSEAEKQIEVRNAALPVVADLAGEIDDNGDVTLTWSEAKNIESFEAADEWAYGETVRGFRNIDRDQSNVWTMNEATYPGKGMPKAFQVFCAEGIDNPLLAAHTGTQYMLGMSSRQGVTDDWLISPEVKGGTEMSFWLDVLDPQYPETVYVMVSKTGNDPDDFVQLEDGEITPESREWRQYTFTLPSDAKYFALWHNGHNGANQFGVRIDDIAFEPARSLADIDGYNVYRDGVLVASALKATSYVDKDVDASAPVQYVVRTTGMLNGERVESERSNVVWVSDTNGVTEVASDGSIRAALGGIVVTGHADDAIVVADAMGRILVSGVVSSDKADFALPQGVYVVKCGNSMAKVIVK